MSVTSSGRSSMSSTMSTTSGWFLAIELAIFCSSIVLPVRGGATISARWPLPIGVIRSMTRVDMSPGDLELEPLHRVERRQVVEEDLVAGDFGVLEVDRLDLDQGEVALALLGRADLAGDRVAGAQVEAADLRGRDVDVVRAGQVVVVRRAQEAEAVGQALEHALGEDQAALLGLRLQDLEDQLLLAQRRGALDAQVLRHLHELVDRHLLERPDVERLLGFLRRRRRRRGRRRRRRCLLGWLRLRLRLRVLGSGFGHDGSPLKSLSCSPRGRVASRSPSRARRHPLPFWRKTR